MTSLAVINSTNPANVVAARPTLPIIAAITRALLVDAPFAERVAELFTLLGAVVAYRDSRLLCWAQGAQPGIVGLLYTGGEACSAPWDDHLTRRVAERDTALRETVQPLGHAPLTYLGVPIRWDGQLWGVIELRAAPDENGANNALGAAAAALLMALVPQLAAAIAASANEQPAARTSTSTFAIAATSLVLDGYQRSLLGALARELEAPLPLHALLSFLLRWSLDTLAADAGAIVLVDAAAGELAIQVFEGYQPSMLDLDQLPRVSWEHGLAGRVARSGRAALLRDVQRTAPLLETSHEFRAELAVPIGPIGQPIAVLVLSSTRPSAFNDGDLAFLQALCDHAAQPLRRALELQAVMEARTQLGQVFVSLPTGLALIDMHGQLLRCNPAWYSIWQVAEPPVGQNAYLPWDLVPPLLARLPEPLQLTDFCAEGQQSPDQVKTAHIRLLNPTQELQILSVPTRDSLGRLTGRLWAVSDVTREREVDRLKNEFVSVVSHELRTPLTSILGYTELLLTREFPPDERRTFVKTVYDQADQLKQLVEDLLVSSRLDAGQVRLNRWVLSLRPLLLDLTNQLIAQVGERHPLLIVVPERLPPILADKDKLRQVLLNLLNNAVKYSPEGGEVTLSAEVAHRLPPEHPPGQFVLISVRDQGMGIAREDLPRIFDRFYRVDNSNTRRIGGTGLGLAITRALVELHGGRIWATSRVGQGSVFSFTMPIANQPAHQLPRPQS